MKTLFLSLLLLCVGTAQALDLSDISNRDAVAALRTALSQGASKAVLELGVTDGFLGNPEVKIPLPPALQKLDKNLRMFGLSAQADELITAMNRAAEAAVPQAKTLLLSSIKNMSIEDAKAILTGGDDSATQYFRGKTTEPLSKTFLPIIAKANSKVGVANTYNSFAGRLASLGLLDSTQANLDEYVTHYALEGLYKMIAQEELAIRKDPIGQTSAILRKVFGR